MFRESFFCVKGAVKLLGESAPTTSESDMKCILLLLYWKFWHLWYFCTKWNFVNINILSREDIKNFRYCLHVLIPAEVEVKYWFPVLNHCLTVFIDVLIEISPHLIYFQITHFLCSLHFHNCLVFYYFEYAFINVKHFKHSTFR